STDSSALKYTWLRQETEMPNSDVKGIKLKQVGNYQLLTEHRYGCKIYSQPILISSLSIQQLNTNSIHIYPNPTDEIIFITGTKGTATAVLYDITGKKL